ncbi:hypothetical protein F5Y00DRAFT_268621 [Daldinia vernicosa]|uniref:uncharacterized protein n=1 Tax=Daldinia vernicosa TaxID=114800 RepID=UPI0020075A1C|nr:uncharacterized protein F5Y00DRAFT_268621 [Daldinia vernicosa]KAI0850127.1 hypothetical protein F5Y00DRAFT_268621 [Daldinia vernicosa]
MPALDVDSQFKFLIVCIKHSTAGKVDFAEVAKECEIVSKGAAAKRYERLMKAHGIGTAGGVGGVKKESKDTKDGIKTRTPNKKRKLAAVDEDAGDADEPVKAEIKGEVKTEDSIAVKAEQENGCGATAAVPGVNEAAPTSQADTSPSTNAQNDDDDDEVLVISATERRDDGGGVSVYGSGGHHHSYSHPHSPAPIIPGIHSFDYAANMTFPQQTTTMRTTTIPSSHNSLPYGFPPGTWMFPHDTHGYL